MSERPPPPPEGRVITAALEQSGLSARNAARRADISEGRWRQIVSGYQIVSAGVYAPVRGPADTLARMAKAVGAPPEAFEEAGRPDVADAIRRDQATAEEPTAPEIKDPTPTEAALLSYIAAMQQELANVNAKIEAQGGKLDEQGGKIDELLERRQQKSA